MMNFYDTVAGRRFFDYQLPGLTKALQGIADALSRPQPVLQVPVENAEKFLHDLFYGHTDTMSLIFGVIPRKVANTTLLLSPI